MERNPLRSARLAAHLEPAFERTFVDALPDMTRGTGNRVFGQAHQPPDDLDLCRALYRSDPCDGAEGVLLAYSLSAPKGLEVCQFRAMRLDDGMLTTLTVSTERAQLTDELKEEYLLALGSATLA